MTYRFLPLSVIAKYEPRMAQLGVSVVARSRRGFLTEYKRVGGDPKKLSAFWLRKRDGFIARFLPMWRAFRTERVRLALIAWAYMPGGTIAPRRRVR